jgi:hypothetical protein
VLGVAGIFTADSEPEWPIRIARILQEETGTKRGEMATKRHKRSQKADGEQENGDEEIELRSI